MLPARSALGLEPGERAGGEGDTGARTPGPPSELGLGSQGPSSLGREGLGGGRVSFTAWILDG